MTQVKTTQVNTKFYQSATVRSQTRCH